MTRTDADLSCLENTCHCVNHDAESYRRIAKNLKEDITVVKLAHKQAYGLANKYAKQTIDVLSRNGIEIENLLNDERALVWEEAAEEALRILNPEKQSGESVMGGWANCLHRLFIARAVRLRREAKT